MLFAGRLGLASLVDQSSDDDASTDASISDYLHLFSEFIKCGKLV